MEPDKARYPSTRDFHTVVWDMTGKKTSTTNDIMGHFEMYVGSGNKNRQIFSVGGDGRGVNLTYAQVG